MEKDKFKYYMVSSNSDSLGARFYPLEEHLEACGIEIRDYRLLFSGTAIFRSSLDAQTLYKALLPYMNGCAYFVCRACFNRDMQGSMPAKSWDAINAARKEFLGTGDQVPELL